jgi:riboflavin kinase/FMN adenylyltransferase
MQLFQNLADVHLPQPTVLTIGTFDGLHRGHQDVIRQLKTAAQKHQAQTAVIAFHPRPKAVFAPDRFKNDYLTSPNERISLFKQLSIDVLILIPFTRKLAQTPAFDFMQQLTHNINLVQLCVGHDFALGKNREGTIEKLTELGSEFNYTVGEIKPFSLENTIVSSTQIRKYLLAGDVRSATYSIGKIPFF